MAYRFAGFRQRGHPASLWCGYPIGQESAAYKEMWEDAQQEGHPAGDATKHPPPPPTGERDNFANVGRTYEDMGQIRRTHERTRRRLSRLVRALNGNPPVTQTYGSTASRGGSRRRAGILDARNYGYLYGDRMTLVRAVSRPVQRPGCRPNPEQTADRGRTPARRDGALPRTTM